MRFEYLEPTSVEEAVSLLARYGKKARVIAGGTDLLRKIRQKEIGIEYAVDITGIRALDYISCDDLGLRIGALTTIRTLQKSAEVRQNYPIISQAAGQMASTAIRNVATLGGNLCNAAPSADSAPCLIALDSRAKIAGPEGERVVPVEDLFTGPGTTNLKVGELLVEIQVPVPLPGTKGAYLKHGLRGPVDLAIVGVAVVMTLDQGAICRGVRLVLGAVAPTPIRAKNAEEMLRGKKISQAMVDRCAQAASDAARPITDVRASAEYRREMVGVFTRAALTNLCLDR